MSRRRNFALLVDYYGGEYQSGVIQGAMDAARKLDGNLIILVTRWLDSPDIAEAVQDYISRHVKRPTVDAVLVASGCLTHFLTPARLGQFFGSLAPLPAVSISVEVPSVPSLVLDNRVAQKAAVDHLIEEHHCRRIAYVGGPAGSIEASQRLAGYKASLEEHGITFDPEICAEGNFWTDSGYRIAESLLKRGASLDAIVAANDYMALGAIKALKHLKIRVPEAIRVVGFDGISTAKMSSPPLTTVRQPMQRMAALAIDVLNGMLDGTPAEPVYRVDFELTRRPSCGCVERLYHVPVPKANGPEVGALPVSDAASLEDLARLLAHATAFPESHWAGVVESLAVALKAELMDSQGTFIRVLTMQLEDHETDPELLEAFYAILESLRRECRAQAAGDAKFEDLFQAAFLTISGNINRVHMRTRFEQNNAQRNVGFNVERLSTVFTLSALGDALQKFLPSTGIRSACIGRYEPQQPELMEAIAVTCDDSIPKLQGKNYSASELAPGGFFPVDRRTDFVVLPLNHGETLYGQAVLEAGDYHLVYTLLRGQIGSTLKSIELYRSVIEATTRRERAEREMLERDTAIAKQIQTAILPKQLKAPKLDIAAIMQPAASIGGDYYDVIPIEGGCFIGIGDVTGHGLLAGMIMLMVQSMISAAVRLNSERTPAELLPDLNRALFDSTRDRLQVDDHVTLTLIKYMPDGKLVLSGAHEDILIYRKKLGRCERISPPGFWLAAVEDVSPMTHDTTAQLESGDCLILYTDGITESMNATDEQFGLARLISAVEGCADQSPQSISDTVMRALSAWSHTQTDDVTLLIAKYG